MIVTLTGAYRNAGDHLIGARATALLRKHVDSDIVNIDRKSIRPEHYEIFNRARAVVLCGGPAYQRGIFPRIYPLRREKISRPIVPLGLGWKGKVDQTPETFSFTPEGEAFIKDIHKHIEQSSARDPLTVQVLERIGVRNVVMTGCPAWYDLETLEAPYVFDDEVRTLVLSMPAAMQPHLFELAVWLARRFPKARRILSFHHGLLPGATLKARMHGGRNLGFAIGARLRNWRIASLAGSLTKFEQLYGNADLHVGYRVHAHLYCLSRRIASVLINEDSRGVGQVQALGGPRLMSNGTLGPIQAAIEAHFESRGEAIAASVAKMRDTYPTMKRFLATL